jgi:hypothetical protein
MGLIWTAPTNGRPGDVAQVARVNQRPCLQLASFSKKLAKGMYNTQTGVVYVILILAYRRMYRQLIQSIDREAFCKLFSVLHCA